MDEMFGAEGVFFSAEEGTEWEGAVDLAGILSSVVSSLKQAQDFLFVKHESPQLFFMVTDFWP